jgi:hypothetical protein
VVESELSSLEPQAATANGIATNATDAHKINGLRSTGSLLRDGVREINPPTVDTCDPRAGIARTTQSRGTPFP